MRKLQAQSEELQDAIGGAARSHEEIQKERDRLSSLLNSISDEVWFADARGNFTLANPSAAREFNLKTSESRSRKLAESLEVTGETRSLRPVDEAPSRPCI